MIELYGPDTLETRFLENLLRLKYPPFLRVPRAFDETHAGPTLKHNTLILQYTLVIAEYINDRFPYPNLEPEDPAKRAIIKMLCKKILKSHIDPSDLRQYLEHRRPFVLGASPTLLDIVIEPVANNPHFSKDLTHYAQSSSWSIL